MEGLTNDSVITVDEIIDTPETLSIDSINKKQNIKWIIIFFTIR